MTEQGGFQLEQQQHQQQMQVSVPENERVMSVKEWLITFLIMMVPVVNLVMYFVWAFGSEGNLNRKNWAKANLLIMGVCIGLYLCVFFFILILAFIGASVEQ
ncbi:hypothetical protein H7K37_14815 [Brevibacillus brevis]|nr:hypothetical protein [Brevibacillus brevis]MCE0452442.1 hypothetical protein [Brevibacillus sp. AF8]